MDSPVFTSTYSTAIRGEATYNVVVSYSENYNASTNKTTIAITGVKLQLPGNTTIWGSLPFFGAIKVAGATLLNMNGGSSVRVTIDDGNYHSVAIPASGTVDITHADDGTGSFTMELVGGFAFEADNYFCAIYDDVQQIGTNPLGHPIYATTSYPFGVKAQSKTCSLTSRGYTLTTAVSPSGYGTVTAGATLAANKKRTLSATPTANTAEYNYFFKNWTKDYGSYTGTNPIEFTMPASNATVTAVFERIKKAYTVTCEDRVGSSSGAKLGTQTQAYTYGQSVSGASFGSDSSYDKYYTGYHYTGSSAATTVVGVTTVYRYFALNTWPVTYNANGHGTAPANQTKTFNSNLTLRSAIPAVTTGGADTTVTITGNNSNGDSWSGSNGSAHYNTLKHVYTHTKWNTNSGGTGTNYALGATYAADAALALYAVWSDAQTAATGTSYTLPTGTPVKNSATETVTVTFNANTGSTSKSSQTSTRTTSYTFKGWFTAATGGTQRTVNSRVTAAETVYAQYTSSVGAWSAVTLPTAVQCTKTGYTLLGFSTSSTATTAAYAPGASYTPSASITLYAVWKLISYTVSYDANGGSPTPAIQSFNYNGSVTLASAISRADSSPGNYYVGYDINYAGGTNPPTATAKRTTHYAFSKWKADDSTLYNANALYSINASTTMTAQWAETETRSSITTPTPTRAGYTFDAWYGDYGTRIPGGYTYSPSSSYIVHARWVLNTYKLSISQGAGTTVTVTRNGTPLADGDTISHFDVLSISISANTGFNIGAHKVNGSDWLSGSYTVSGNVNIVATATVQSFKMYASVSPIGVTVNLNRTSSPLAGHSTGLVHNGDTIYYNDVINVSYSLSTGYDIETATINGATMSGTSENVTITQDCHVTILVDNKAVVYIGNEAYQAFIGNGSSWELYEAFIGNGSGWDAY